MTLDSRIGGTQQPPERDRGPSARTGDPADGPPPNAASTHAPPPRARVTMLHVAVAALVLAALWALDAMVLRTDMLASIDGRDATTPYYAVLWPRVRASAITFLLAAAAFVLVAPRLADPLRTSGRVFAGALALAAFGLPFTLFLVRDSAASLGTQFTHYPRFEFFDDARSFESTALFLRTYVDQMSTLSSHGQHFPPGNALLLHFVREIFGPSELAAGIVVLFLAAAGVVCAWAAFRELLDSHAARHAALFLVTAPALLDFTCTSMDVVYFTAAACAWWLALRAARTGRALDAAAAGVVLFLATFESFSALPLGLAIGIHTLVLDRARPARAAVRLAWIGGAWVVCGVLVLALTGFSIASCFVRANELARELMTHVGSTRQHASALNLAYGNLSAFLIGAGAPLVAGVALALRSRPVRRAPWTIATLLTIAVLCGLHWMETERIWLYVLPWLCVIAAGRGPLDRSSARLWISCACAQALVMEVILFTLW